MDAILHPEVVDTGAHLSAPNGVASAGGREVAYIVVRFAFSKSSAKVVAAVSVPFNGP